MRKVITIAVREYRAMVATKAFIFSMTMMPLLMFGGILAMELLKNVGEINEHKIVVIDQTDRIFQQLDAAAGERNRLLDKMLEQQEPGIESTETITAKSNGSDNDDDEFGNFSRGARLELQRWTNSEFTDEDRLELSNRIRQQEIYAFIEIPANVMDASLPFSIEDIAKLPKIKFYSEDSSFSETKVWMGSVVNEFVKTERLKEVDIDPLKVAKASLPIRMKAMSLVEKTATGEIKAGKEKDTLSAIFLPLGVMMLMFMVIFMASQPMLESVLEEKSQRIAEVLLGCVSPFQLMTGKLFGTVAGSLTILVIYLGGALFLANYRGWGEQIPYDLIPWFIVFQVGGVLLFASIFMAVGASVTQLKEAQSMLLPVWMLMMSPMFIWFMVIREPNGTLATYFSLFPPATPTMMMLRMSTGATIALWEKLLAVVLLIITTVFCIYVASRIFRVGLLWQGKTPKFNELLKWAFRG